MEKEDVVTEELWSDRGGWRDGGGIVSKIRGIEVSLSLLFTLPLSVSTDGEGKRWKELGGETTRLTLVEPRSKWRGP